MNFAFTQDERRRLLATARSSIAARLESRAAAVPKVNGALGTPCGAFVTLREEGKLRGCIGRMSSPDPLIETVAEMAKAAAFEDPRFSPLTIRELNLVEIEITALAPMRPVASLEEIVLGKHGLHLSLGWHSGVFLPQVPIEQGWDLETYLEQLCLKAGIPLGSWKSPTANLSLFEGLAFGEADDGLEGGA